MIGIGQWACSVDTMMFRGDAILTVAHEDGVYSLTAQVQNMEKMPAYAVEQITEDGNTLNAIVTTPLLPGKQVPISLTFEGDDLTGYAKVPLLGKIKLKNGHRI